MVTEIGYSTSSAHQIRILTQNFHSKDSTQTPDNSHNKYSLFDSKTSLIKLVCPSTNTLAFLISNFRPVLNTSILCFLLGSSPASELYMPTFRNTICSIFIGRWYHLPMKMARSQYSEGPATGHLDTGFSWFPCVYKQMLRWFPRIQVATTCFSCSPPDLNLVVTNFMFCIHVT